MTEIGDLQRAISIERVNRGFVTDPVKLQVLLAEEIGEMASEIKKLWSKNYGQFDQRRIEDEVADAFVLLAAMAEQFDIDIEKAVARKFFQKDGLREWKSAIE